MTLSIKRQLFLFLLIPAVLFLFFMYVIFFPDFKMKSEKDHTRFVEYLSFVFNEIINEKVYSDLNKVEIFKKNINENHLYVNSDNPNLKLLLKNLLNSDKHYTSAWFFTYNAGNTKIIQFAEYYKTNNDFVY